MRNSRLDRILYIQQVLVQGGVLNKQQTADRFGVSEKTSNKKTNSIEFSSNLLDTRPVFFNEQEAIKLIIINI